MRRTWLTWCGACLGAVLGLAACGDDDAVVVPDATPVPDASIIDDGGGGPDARPLFGPITVLVYDEDGRPRPDTPVVVARFDSVEAVTGTAADGTAHPMVNSGDQVTVGFDFASKGTIRRMVTWNGVEPGDVLTFGSPSPDFTSLGTLMVTTPGPFEGATVYQATSGCEIGTLEAPGPFSFNLVTGCHGDPAHIPVLLNAFAPDGHLLAYAGGETMVESMVASASLDTWRTDPIAFTSALTGLPDPAPSVRRHLALLARGDELFELPLTESPTEASAQVPQGIAPDWVYAQVLTDPDLSAVRSCVVAGAAPIPGAIDLDASGGLLARIGDITVDASFPERTQVFWTLDATSGSTATDAIVVDFQLAEGSVFGDWLVISAGGPNTTHVPVLPESMASFRPTHAPRAVTVMAIESNNADYGQLRRVLNGLATDPESLWPVVTRPLRSGTALISSRQVTPPQP